MMTKPRYKRTWLMGILLATLTLTSPPTPAVGPLIGILVEIGKGVLTEVVLDMLQEEPGKDTEGLEVQANPDQLDAAYSSGLGVDRNPIFAYQWFSLAANQGHQNDQILHSNSSMVL